jgi:CheY-like chemotaxis protein
VVETQTNRKIVLTLEDQPAIADLLSFLLEASELEIKHCDDGAEGLALVKELKPALVIMDVMMPTMDGWQVYDAIRGDEKVKEVPIIMLSVAHQETDRRAAFRGSNIDFYLTKPFDVNTLRRKVQEILGLEIWIKSPPPDANPTEPSPPHQVKD